MADCPTCHSKISEDQSLLVNRRRGAISPGVENLPEVILSSDPDIVPLWTDDPIRNPEGFNGIEYVGVNKIGAIWFEELQEVRSNEEAEVGIPEAQKTVFSPIRGQKIGVKHITELRESIEKILNAVGTTLEEYFATDQDGNEATANPNDTQEKNEWTDVSRGTEYTGGDGLTRGTFVLPDGTTVDSPTFPRATHIKTVHIEDLRHPLQLGWREFWSVTPVGTILDFTDNFESVDQTNDVSFVDPDDGQIDGLGRSGDGSTTTITSRSIIDYEDEFGNDIFPNGFEVKPSDGGNRWLSAEDERSWLVVAAATGFTQSMSGVVSTMRSGPEGNGCPIITVASETGTRHVANADHELLIENSTDEDVLALKSNSKTLKYAYSRDSVHTPRVQTSSIINAFHSFELKHAWRTPSVFAGDETQPEAFADRNIRIKKDTAFKYLLKASVSGQETLKRSLYIEEFGSGFAAESGGVFTYAGVGEPTQAQLDDLELESDTVPIPSAFENNVVEWLIKVYVPSIELTLSFTIRMGDTSVFSQPPFTEEIQAPFSGQALKVNGNASVIYLDGTSEFDVAINLNDLLAIKNSKTPFGYVNQKVLDEETSEVVQNPEGTEVYLQEAIFTVDGSGTGRFVNTLGVGKFLDIKLIGEEEDLCRSAFNYIQGAEVWWDYSEAGTFELEAIRVENNNKTVRGA